ncbi:MAG: hypothetical protein L6Q54_00585 [Leptospiraceae bacterium]|nr:hypothetical protein [Leptospiraceae bacterium]MCK6379733.1 hypothetical protein [Leptospiraceae bacterium]NUM41682.1 hypothetical protein [Leptospiraceae bacterium]
MIDLFFSCSVCGGPVSKNALDAYLFITILMTSLPVILIGIFFFLVKRRIKDESK